MRDALLYELQENFPIEVRPYLSIAKNLGLSEDDVIRMLREEKEKGILRQTSAIFDTKKLGYSSSLVAFKVTNEHIEEAVKILNSHPGISHNYERNHDFNIWFTIAIPPYSTLGLQKSIDLLFKLTKANDVLYDRETHEIESIPSLLYMPEKNKFMLKSVETKRVSTMKSMSPKRTISSNTKS